MKHTHPSTLVVDIFQIHMESTQITQISDCFWKVWRTSSKSYLFIIWYDHGIIYWSSEHSPLNNLRSSFYEKSHLNAEMCSSQCCLLLLGWSSYNVDSCHRALGSLCSPGCRRFCSLLPHCHMLQKKQNNNKKQPWLLKGTSTNVIMSLRCV